jgi:copper resistance protein B
MDMEDMEMDHGAAPSSGLRDPHDYAEGYDFSQFPMRHEGGEIKYGTLRVDRLEAVRAGGNTIASYDLQAGYGGDFERALFKSEGDIDSGELDEASTELLWSHAVAAFWNTQLGLRYDSGEGPNRSWLAAGIQGLAPYWFEVDATAYVGEDGRTALNLEAEYELLFTQKWILQPRLEADFYGKNDAELGKGSGLSEMAAGLRLRYEIRRELAPYVGVEWAGKFGDTADYARDAGLDTKETRAVAGVRFWF